MNLPIWLTMPRKRGSSVGDSFDLVRDWEDAICTEELRLLMPNWHFSWFKVTLVA